MSTTGSGQMSVSGSGGWERVIFSGSSVPNLRAEQRGSGEKSSDNGGKRGPCLANRITSTWLVFIIDSI
jgi:hypothetical protein